MVTRDGYGQPTQKIEIIEASHPLPDHRGVVAAERILALAKSARAGDLVVCLWSGGASALMVAPPQSMGFTEKQNINAVLLRSGATIGEINCVRKHLSSDRVHAVYNGINTDGYTSADAPLDPPVLGFFSRMCRDKGLDTLVEAFVQLRQRNRVPRLKLRVGGGCGPSDEPFVEGLRQNLHAHGLLGDVDFQRNLDRAGKQRFLKSLSVLSVPAAFGEAFGFYVIEAIAAGVPVVQPRTASFPELVEATGGGVCYEPTDVPALVDAIEKMLLAPAEAKAMGLCGRDVVLKQFSHTTMARSMAELFAKVSAQPHPA